MATTNQRLTELEKDVAALETWKGQQIIHNRKQEEVDAALAARIAKLEGAPPVEPPPVEPPPVTAPPVASFTTTPASGQAPLTVVLKDTSTGNPTSWAWDIGQGMFKYTTKDAQVVLPAADSWTVKLTVTNAGGSATATKQVVVSTGPVIEPIPPVPGQPPANGIVVMAGGGLRAAALAAPSGSALILRGGDHVLGNWGSSTSTSNGIQVANKKLSFWAYQGELPRVHAGSSRPNLLYSVGGGVVDAHGIKFATIERAYYDDSNGSAMCESQGGGILDLFDCWLEFYPRQGTTLSIDNNQHLFYVADHPGRATATRCHFDGGKNEGTGFHLYHAPGGKCSVTDSDFKNFGFGPDNGIAVIIDQDGADIEVIHNTFKDCTYAAIQHRVSARAYVKDNVGTNTARGLQKSSSTNLTDINNVWN